MKATLVIGSCRPPRSNSAAIARFLRSELERRGAVVDDVEVLPWRDEDPDLPDAVLEALRTSDALVLIAPVYLDSLPAPALRLLGRIHQRRAALGDARPAVYGVVHSGYFQPAHQGPGLETCAAFARETGCRWLGGLGFGGTSPIGGLPLEDVKGLTRHLRPALALLARAVVEGQPVPPRAVALSRKPVVPLPLWLIVRLLNVVTMRQLRAKGIADPMARPYDPPAAP